MVRHTQVKLGARRDRPTPGQQTLLAAMVAGKARWEGLGDSRRGEVCTGGLRYSTHLDETGCPVIDPVTRAALEQALERGE